MIPILNLTRQYQELKTQIDEAVLNVVSSGYYILGPNVTAFEQEAAAYNQTQFAIGCASGTDALYLALRALNIGRGDEVITTPFTYIATSESIVMAGARPVLVDIRESDFNMDPALIEQAITPRTKAILPVHIYGHPAAMDEIMAIAKKHDLYVIEDCAQSMGATYNGKRTGSMGQIGCYSFFPSKNLGAYGDGGLMTTSDPVLAERLKSLRVHGQKTRYHHEEAGLNSRLDEIQAAILRVKLPHLDSWNHKRATIAANYSKALASYSDMIATPQIASNVTHSFHQYTLRLKGFTGEVRDKVQQAMQEAGIQTMIYYPVPLYNQKTHADLGYKPESFPICEHISREVLSLPMFPELSVDEQTQIVDALVTAVTKFAPARV